MHYSLDANRGVAPLGHNAIFILNATKRLPRWGMKKLEVISESDIRAIYFDLTKQVVPLGHEEI